MQSAFVQAFTYSPPVILGRRLLPFSPWHGIFLEATDSSYLLGGPHSFDDLISGIWLCSRSFLNGWASPGDLREAKRWGRRARNDDLVEAYKLFDDHVKVSLSSPEYWRSPDSQSLRAPFFWHLATFGVNYLHLSEQQAWDYPVARLTCYLACKSENEGGKDLMSEEDSIGFATLKAEQNN